MFKAILIERDPQYRAQLKNLEDDALPAGEVSVRVSHSTLNYKDALAVTGQAPVVRAFPMVPGIDLCGTVDASSVAGFSVGQRVVLNGFGVGETHWGGLSQRARLKGEWLIPLPERFSPRQAMSIGTAGYTAMLCVLALEQHGIRPQDGEVLVTGAAGGVGSVAIVLLAKLGYRVTASTGRPAEAQFLRGLGAAEIIDRAVLAAPGKPVQKERWAAAVDVVGGQTLVNVCASLRYGGIVAACGLTGGSDLPGTVLPFILRGITLAGIDSVMRPRADRIEAWRRLALDLDIAQLEALTEEIGLSDVVARAPQFLAGAVRGRLVVDTSR